MLLEGVRQMRSVETLAVKSYDLLKRGGNLGKVWRPDWIGLRTTTATHDRLLPLQHLQLESLGLGFVTSVATWRALCFHLYISPIRMYDTMKLVYLFTRIRTSYLKL